jgi:hypothetical protein
VEVLQNEDQPVVPRESGEHPNRSFSDNNERTVALRGRIPPLWDKAPEGSTVGSESGVDRLGSESLRREQCLGQRPKGHVPSGHRPTQERAHAPVGRLSGGVRGQAALSDAGLPLDGQGAPAAGTGACEMVTDLATFGVAPGNDRAPKA